MKVTIKLKLAAMWRVVWLGISHNKLCLNCAEINNENWAHGDPLVKSETVDETVIMPETIRLVDSSSQVTTTPTTQVVLIKTAEDTAR